MIVVLVALTALPEPSVFFNRVIFQIIFSSPFLECFSNKHVAFQIATLDQYINSFEPSICKWMHVGSEGNHFQA